LSTSTRSSCRAARMRTSKSEREREAVSRCGLPVAGRRARRQAATIPMP
jgi:hypothetical protein